MAKFFDESRVASRFAFSETVFALNNSLVRLSRVIGAELSPATTPAIDEKLFNVLNSCKSAPYVLFRQSQNRLTMAVCTKYFIVDARTLTSFELRICKATQPAILLAVRMTHRTFGADFGPSSFAHALLRHSIARIRWKWSDSMIVNCRASSTGEISSRRIERPLGTRGMSGAGGDSRPPDTVLLGPSPPEVRCGSANVLSQNMRLTRLITRLDN